MRAFTIHILNQCVSDTYLSLYGFGSPARGQHRQVRDHDEALLKRRLLRREVREFEERRGAWPGAHQRAVRDVGGEELAGAVNEARVPRPPAEP